MVGPQALGYALGTCGRPGNGRLGRGLRENPPGSRALGKASKMKRRKQRRRRLKAPPDLVLFGLGWAFLGVGITWFWTGSREALLWFFKTWAVSLADLWALAQLVRVLLEVAAHAPGASEGRASSEEKRISYSIQALVWGVLKLGCLGLIGTILYQASLAETRARLVDTGFSLGVILGFATMVVVPLGWGYRRSLEGS